jgi:hypothetical protein
MKICVLLGSSYQYGRKQLFVNKIKANDLTILTILKIRRL